MKPRQIFTKNDFETFLSLFYKEVDEFKKNNENSVPSAMPDQYERILDKIKLFTRDTQNAKNGMEIGHFITRIPPNDFKLKKFKRLENNTVLIGLYEKVPVDHVRFFLKWK